MGYYIEIIDSKVKIKKENFEEALLKLKHLFKPGTLHYDYVFIEGTKYPKYSFIATEKVILSNSIDEALEEIRYKPKFDKIGNIVNLEFTGEKYGDEIILFSTLAPFIEDGSFLKFRGEDGCIFRFDFLNGKVTY